MDNQEIEAKFYVHDLSRIKSRLHVSNAREVQRRVLERNIRFDTPDQAFRNSGRVLRLRQDSEIRLTFKGPSRNETGVLSRTEIEFAVEDFEKARLLLEALGYRQIFFYEKYRTTYDLGGTHVMLDELPYGDFVEIEGQDVDRIHMVAEQLGLQWGYSIPTSYHILFERVAHARRLESNELSFDLFKDLDISMEEMGVQAAD